MRKLTRQRGWLPTSHRSKLSAHFGHRPDATLCCCQVSIDLSPSCLPQLSPPLWSVALSGRVLGEGQGAILWGSFTSGACKRAQSGQETLPSLSWGRLPARWQRGWPGTVPSFTFHCSGRCVVIIADLFRAVRNLFRYATNNCSRRQCPHKTVCKSTLDPRTV